MNRAALACILVPAIAHADPDRFVTIDRQDGSTREGVETSALVPSQYAYPPSDIALRLDGHMQYVAENGLGGYGAMTFGYTNVHRGFGLGDGELGVLWAVRVGDLTLVPHAGAVLPIGPVDHGAGPMGARGARLADALLATPDATGVRLSLSALYRTGSLFWRADAGYETGTSQDMALPNVVRANLAGGVDLGRAAVMVESTNYVVLGGPYFGYFVDSGALSARYDAGGASPYVALVFGLDDDSRALLRAALTVGVDVSVR